MALRLKHTPARILFRRTILDTHPISAGALNFVSDNIISTRQLPCKMLIFFIKSVAFNGDYKKNPLELIRKLPVYVTTPEIQRITQRVIHPEPQPPATRRPARPAPPPPRGWGLTRRQRDQTPIPEPAPEPSAPPEPLVIEEVETIPGVTVLKGYSTILDVNLTCGGHRVDSFHTINNDHDALIDYERLSFFAQQTGTPFGNSITYEAFLQSYYICSFDFTTAQNSNFQFLTPSTRFGHLRVEVQFSDNLPEELQMCVLQVSVVI